MTARGCQDAEQHAGTGDPLRQCSGITGELAEPGREHDATTAATIPVRPDNPGKISGKTRALFFWFFVVFYTSVQV
jgi:hypothetical protein